MELKQVKGNQSKNMKPKSKLISFVLSAGCWLLAALPAPASFIIQSGWDLLQTNPAQTTFLGFNFQGIPIGAYDFGPGIGIENVALADTIVQRLEDASVPGAGNSDTIAIELAALQLRSVNQINLGAGLDYYFITLQSVRGGLDSTGEMTIDFGLEGSPHGTFDSWFNVYFDLRIGALDGAIVASDVLTMSGSDTPWDHIAPSGAWLIEGVNDKLNGNDLSQDFWPGPISEEHPFAQHSVSPAQVPDPTPMIEGVLLIPFLASTFRFLRKQRDTAQ